MGLLSLDTSYPLLGAALLALVAWKLVKLFSTPRNSCLRDLPAPPPASWLYGNSKQIFEDDVAVVQEAWARKYGHVFKYKGFLSVSLVPHDVLYTTDVRALNHVLGHSNDFQKPGIVRNNLASLLGEGLLVVEGEQHRQQRRIMNPAFGPAQIRELTEIFVEKAIQASKLACHLLRDVWSAHISKMGESTPINVSRGLSDMTFDVIGLAGFNYTFDNLDPQHKPSELNEAFKIIFARASSRPSIFPILRRFVPFFSQILKLSSLERQRIIAFGVMKRIGMQLVKEKKDEVLKATAAEKLQSRDLLTLLIKANMDPSIPESHRLSDEDVLAQVPTFLVAGHETTSNATAWALFALSQAPEVQQKLREEIMNIPTENPSMDELSELPYLDAVVRETMRVHAPVPVTVRIATKDDVIPLHTPFTDVHGKIHDSVSVSEGTYIDIPILAVNRSKALWGEDAFEFKLRRSRLPERWESIPPDAHTIPGVWGNMMSFLGGPRACIGYRFSVIEMKALIFTLVRAFEFELAVPASRICAARAAVQRPRIRDEDEKGNQLPMLLKPYKPL
ncbi:uncharacterized protein FIBRA_07587 [Fibroporia radiculosa]|uniref:Cytochrome P450 n=1 Tax=Fibroporia radiculosa TaxID=599839 RepID=J4IBW5_9APHY|nr:uncharacterized protein FIBRA_07587 [Fibroporia radiculosa]CCM05371.1 predicted protein [Fibroporia radiculosa]